MSALPLLRWLAPTFLFSLLASPAHAAPPWQIWDDLRSVAVIPAGDQVLLRSSHCPGGCASDKHGPGEPKFLRRLGEEGVIFEETGPGAITRLWMTSGGTASEPLDPKVRIRFYFDGEATPRIDLPLPDLFSGQSLPFTPPLVADRLASSGGYVSYVPIPFAQHCVVTLRGAESTRLWFQLSYHRLAVDQPVASYTGQEDLARWRALLGTAGSDPWSLGIGSRGPGSSDAETIDEGARVSEGRWTLAPGERKMVYSAAGPGLLTGLKLALPRARWGELALELAFDGETTVRLSATDFFGIGGDLAQPTRSLLIGADDAGLLYSYFPLPFERAASVTLVSTAPVGRGDLHLTVAVRRAGAPPLPGSGRFHAAMTLADPQPAGSDLTFLTAGRPGKWVGLAAQLGAVGTLGRKYLEGDERVFLDDSGAPALYGTGAEDLFNGGFYFDRETFRLALHGMTAHQVAGGEDRSSAYRLMLTDAVPFGRDLEARLEAGTVGDVPFRARIVSWFYLSAAPPLVRVDRLRLGDAASREAHAYQADVPTQDVAFTGRFEGEPPEAVPSSGLQRASGSSATFQLDASRCAGGARLRRLFDADAGGQAAEVRIAGRLAGAFAYQDANPDHRLRELDLDLPATATGRLDLAVAGQPASAADPPLSELGYELWCRLAAVPLFAAGFETGDAIEFSHLVASHSGARSTRR